MRILHLLSQRPDFTGSGIYLQHMMREAAIKGHQNFLIAGVPMDAQDAPDGIEQEHCLFVTFAGGDLAYSLPGMSDVMPYVSSCFRELHAEEIEAYLRIFSLRIQEAVARWKPDILHSHHLWLMTAIARSSLPEMPIVATCHSTDLRQFTNCPHLRPLVEEPCRGLERIMALSVSQSHEITSLYKVSPAQISVIGGGFNAALFVPGNKPLPPPVQVLYAGKLSRAKGVPWLIQALQRLSHLPFHLHLVGQGVGPEQEECVRLAAELGALVTMHGRLSQKSLATLMGQSHLFVLPSFFEGMPLVLLEALACGCQLVSTDLPGCRELLQGEDPGLVTLLPLPPLQTVDCPFPVDEEALIIQLATIMDQKIQQFLSRSGKPYRTIGAVAAQYSWSAVFSKVEQVYLNVLTSD